MTRDWRIERNGTVAKIPDLLTLRPLIYLSQVTQVI